MIMLQLNKKTDAKARSKHLGVFAEEAYAKFLKEFDGKKVERKDHIKLALLVICSNVCEYKSTTNVVCFSPSLATFGRPACPGHLVPLREGGEGGEGNGRRKYSGGRCTTISARGRMIELCLLFLYQYVVFCILS